MQRLTTANSQSVAFGRRKIAPRAAIIDRKRHIRAFLREAVEELGYVASDWGEPDDTTAMLAAHAPDVVLVGLSSVAEQTQAHLQSLADAAYVGQVVVFGSRESSALGALQEFGTELGLAMLPQLGTPYRTEDLIQRLKAHGPSQSVSAPTVDLGEALRCDWLELWYQPQFDATSLAPRGAEALLRLRHPTWGVVPPAAFLPEEGDPHLRLLADFVVGRAMDDWQRFIEDYGPLDLSINLPLAVLRDPDFLSRMRGRFPDHPAFGGLLIEIDSAELIEDMAFAKDLAKRLRLHNVAIAIDDLGEEAAVLADCIEFPFVEFKVDQQLVTGCADDRFKRSMCRSILEIADHFGARTVAEGVENRADFVAVRELGFHLVQGFMLARPMEPRKFARSMLTRRVPLPL